MTQGVKACLLVMRNSDIMTDVTFVVQGTEIRAHRVIAGSRGGPLREMLEGKDERVIICDEIAPRTFNMILQYLYTDAFSVNHRNLFELMHASRMFKLDDLGHSCADVVKSNLSNRNIGAFATQAVHFDSKECLTVCKEYFRVYAADMIDTEEFLGVSKEALVALLETELIMCSELELFELSIKWARSECQRRNLGGAAQDLRTVLDQVIDKVKLSKMPIDQFLDFVAPMEILTPEEVGQIIVGRQKEKWTHILDKCWTENVKVIIADNVSLFDGKNTKLMVPLSRTISQLKKMKIFSGGTKQYPGYKFTLEHKGKELSDDLTLASVHSVGEDLILQFHSLVSTVRDSKGAWMFPMTMKVEDMWGTDETIVKSELYRLKGINPSRVGKIVRSGWNPDFIYTVYLIN